MLRDIFADSVLEVSWAQRSRRSWTTLTSFVLEALAIGVLLLLPLWKTVGLPKARTVSTPISMGVAPAEPETLHRQPAGSSAPAPTTSTTARFVAPGRIPRGISATSNDTPPSYESCNPACDSSGPVIGATAGLGIPSLLSGNRPVLPAPPPSITHTFRTSTILEGSLIRRVQPVYPQLAKNAHIQGKVVLFAVISKAGTIDNLRVLSGHPMLVPAAIDAVRQWQYRPYILNNEPIEVETQITVNFTLGN
jgi:periplasmic protein TonB